MVLTKHFTLPPSTTVVRAALLATADPGFTCLVNGRPAANGDHWDSPQRASVAHLLSPGGANTVEITATAGVTAGITGKLEIALSDGA